MTVWFITGASRGFGRAIVVEALSRGDRVVATARNPGDITRAFGEREGLLPVALDVTDPAQATSAVATAVEAFGSVDVLVNNAGRGLLGAVEEVDDADVRSMFDVNVHGVLAVTRAVLPHLRERRSGTIITVSSSGGFVSRAGWGAYCASKFAVEGLMEALKLEVAPLGIGVVLIEPGGFRTDALDASSLSTAARIIDDYDGTAGQTRRTVLQANHAQPGDPAKAAAVIVDLGGRNDLPERIQLGQDCFDLVTAKLARVTEQQQAWREISTGTAFSEPSRDRGR